ncbi:hypothetical protein V5O48_018829 [Marasmius crinis-equi]|uniref:MYND-type domain-containing protein n=1 Tax=Marasmius crinis-equi TaxID=585013 RepID=A0ABR3EK72_9AGAR
MPRIADPNSPHAQYFTQAVSRFRTATISIEQLRKLGSPPSTVDLSDPNSKVETACKILISLASHMKTRRATTSSYIRTHWARVLAKWVDFMLRNVILSHEWPSTPVGMNCFECSVTSIAALLDFPDGDARSIKHASPNLQRLMTQAWYLLLNIGHANWGPWSLALINLAQSDPEVPPPPIDPTLPVLYHEDVQLGKIIIKHLNSRIQEIRTMADNELGDLKVFMMLLTTTPQCFEEVNPIDIRINVSGTIEAMADMMAILLFTKRKSLRTGSVESQEYKDAHDLVLLSHMNLDRYMQEPLRVCQMLEAGVINSIVHADTRYYVMDHKHKTKPEGRIARWSARVMGQIGRFLVYPAVLRQFLRSTRKIDVYPDRFFEAAADSVWHSWRNAVQKASMLHDLHRAFKQDGVCSYSGCPLNEEPPVERLKARYLRCFGCTSVAYCSHSCRKADWKEEHRVQCPQIAKMKKKYLHSHAERLTQEIGGYPSTMSHHGHSSEDPSIRDGIRLPILFVDFDIPDIPGGSDARLIDTKVLIDWVQPRYGWNPDWTDSFVRQWEKTDSKSLFVLAAFPRSQDKSWPHTNVVDFPLEVAVDGPMEENQGGSV